MLNYQEYIYNICSETNLDDRDDVIDTIMSLGKECIRYHKMIMWYDDKLKEVMTAKDYDKWATEMGKKLFKEDIEMMDDGDFKEFCKEHYEEITDDDIH